MTDYAKIPKVELHIHLEGAIPYDALFELINKYGGDPTVPDISSLKKRFVYKDFTQFIETWFWKNSFLREYEDFTFISELVARDLQKQNIRYAEMFFSPSTFAKNASLNVQEITSAVRTGFSKVPGISISLIADLVRDYGPKYEMGTLSKLSEVKEYGVIGIGIGGSEHEYPAIIFEDLYKKAHEMGFFTTAHAGEAPGVQSIKDAVFKLHVDRIGHGTKAYDDPEFMNYLAERSIPIELCPLSNVRTGVIKSLKDHPIRKYYNSGLLISVNTDDPKMFGNSLEKEYISLEKELNFSKKEIGNIITMGIESSWLSAEEKKKMKNSFQEDINWIL